MLLKYHPIEYKKVGVFVREELKPIVDMEIKKLHLLGNDLTTIPSCRNLKEIIVKLQGIQSSGIGMLTSYELQTLTFHLIDLPEALREYFLSQYISDNWKQVAIRGLMHSLMHFWDKSFAEQIRNILITHRKEMLSLQAEAFKYMDSTTSVTKLSTYLYDHEISVLNAPQFVLLQEEMYHYPYFEDVILDYFSHTKVLLDTVSMAEKALRKHNVARFDKILLPQLIIKANTKESLGEDIKQELIRVSKEHIGEANDVSAWQDDTLNNDQKGKLLKARQIIRTWQIIRVIENVFQRGARDSYPDRARFWRRYARYLLTLNDDTQPYLRVMSTYGLSDILNIDERKLYYKRLYQGQENTAILMRFGEHTIVELLDGGCMYIYRNHPEQPLFRNMYAYVWSNNVHEIEDLKDQRTRVLVKDDVLYRLNSLPDDVRIAHRGDWQPYFRHLLVMKKVIV